VFTRFCEAIERKDWLEKEDWKTQVGRSKDRKAINAAIGEITKTKPANHWIELFEANGIPCGPIYSIDQVFADPQVKHLGMATKMDSPYVGEKEVVASAINISGFSKAIRAYTPDAGEHGDEVLKSVGYTDAELEDMRRKGVI
jgi:formyl-CoA transferase